MMLATTFEAMGRLPEMERGDEAAVALLLAHLVEAWASGQVVDAGMLAAAHAVTGALPAALVAPAEALLTSVEEGWASDPDARRELTQAVTRFADELSAQGLPALATAVLSARLQRAALARLELTATLHSLLRCANANRRQARFSNVVTIYDVAEAAAVDGRTAEYRLRARLGRADLFNQQGNLRAAEQIIVAAEAEARALGMAEVECLAVTTRAIVAFNQGRFREVPPLALRALADEEGTNHTRWHALTALGVSFMLLGHREAARDSLEFVAASCGDAIIRGRAHLNLMRLAADFGDREGFERHRAILLRSRIEAPSTAPMHCMMGEAYHIFGETGRARECFQRAIDLAREHGVYQWVFTAERGLAELDAGTPPMVEPEPAVLDDIAPAVAHMRWLRAAMPASRA